jgi:Transcriptional regulatory protein, C terminal
MELHGDLHMHTASECCEGCGRPFLVDVEGIIVAGDIISFNGLSATITFRERQLIALFLKNFGETVHRERIFGTIWQDEDVQEKIVDVYVCKLNKKLMPLGLKIVSTWGIGKKLEFFDAQPVANVA